MSREDWATDKPCPKCGGDAWRDSCDVGVGIIYGPWACSECEWSEWGPARVEHGRYIDRWGQSHSIERIADNCERFGIARKTVLDAFGEEDP